MEEILESAEYAVLNTEGVAKLTGKKIAIQKDKNQNYIFDIYVLVNYGARIPDIAWNLQENVKDSILQKCSVTITKINIHIQGISFDEEKSNAQN